jgi:phosphoserine phosphatase
MTDATLRRRVILADWDNTLCEGFTLSAWAEYLARCGLFGAVHTVRDLLDAFRRGLFAYEEFCRRMADAYAEGLVGRVQKEVLAAGAAFIRDDNVRVFPFVPSLWAYFEEHELEVVVLTGAPEEPLHHYASVIGFELAGALRLQVKKGLYTGSIVENCGLYEIKQMVVQRVCANRDVAVAFGDSVSDLPLLNAAPVGFVVLGATHSSIPFGEHLTTFKATSDPNAVVRLVRRRVSEVINA